MQLASALSAFRSVKCLQLASALLTTDGQPWTSGWLTTPDVQQSSSFRLATPNVQQSPSSWRAAELFVSAACPAELLQHFQAPPAASGAAIETSRPPLQPSRCQLETGAPIAVLGSPFGCLQPRVLSNTVRLGHVSQAVVVEQPQVSILDIAALPGVPLRCSFRTRSATCNEVI